jgi:hypothetical protein
MFDQGGFAGAVFTNQPEHAAAWNVEGNSVQDGFRAKPP